MTIASWILLCIHYTIRNICIQISSWNHRGIKQPFQKKKRCGVIGCKWMKLLPRTTGSLRRSPRLSGEIFKGTLRCSVWTSANHISSIEKIPRWKIKRWRTQKWRWMEFVTFLFQLGVFRWSILICQFFRGVHRWIHGLPEDKVTHPLEVPATNCMISLISIRPTRYTNITDTVTTYQIS